MRSTRIAILGATFFAAAHLMTSSAAADWRGGGHNGFTSGNYEGSHRGDGMGHHGYDEGGWQLGRGDPAFGARSGRGEALAPGMPAYD